VGDAYSLATFSEDDCLSVAWQLSLPIVVNEKLELPIDVRAQNPAAGAPFVQFLILTTRTTLDGQEIEAFTTSDELFDENFLPACYSLFGQSVDGELEHIADRKNYAALLELARKLVPQIKFPAAPISRREHI
jgi:hypothetical protein